MPPLVKTISLGRAFSDCASDSRASSTTRRAARPLPCSDEGLPTIARARTHRLDRLGQHRRGRRVIEVGVRIRCCQSWPHECTTPDQALGRARSRTASSATARSSIAAIPLVAEVRAADDLRVLAGKNRPLGKHLRCAAVPRHGDQSVDLLHSRLQPGRGADPSAVQRHPGPPRCGRQLQGRLDGGRLDRRHRHADAGGLGRAALVDADDDGQRPPTRRRPLPTLPARSRADGAAPGPRRSAWEAGGPVAARAAHQASAPARAAPCRAGRSLPRAPRRTACSVGIRRGAPRTRGGPPE